MLKVKRLFDTNFHEWKMILLFLIEKNFGKISNFMDPLIFPNTLLLIEKKPGFQRKILLNWSKFLSYDPTVPSTILFQYLLFNKVSKLEIVVRLFLFFQMMLSILSVTWWT